MINIYIHLLLLPFMGHLLFSQLYHGIGMEMTEDGTGLYYKHSRSLGDISHLTGDVGIHFDNKNDIPSVVEALKNGNCFVTNGPFLNFTCDISNINYKMGHQIACQRGKINIHIISTPEFGLINKIIVYKGEIGAKKEQ